MKQQKGKILLADINRSLVTALTISLRPLFGVIEVCQKHDVPDNMEKEESEILLIELNGAVPQKQIDDAMYIKALKAKYPYLQIIAIVSFADAKLGIEAVKNGATDYVIKPWNNDKFDVLLANARKIRNLEMEINRLKNHKNLSHGEDVFRSLSIEKMEKRMIKAALKKSDGNVKIAADFLGITRQTLYNKSKKYSINLPNR